MSARSPKIMRSLSPKRAVVEAQSCGRLSPIVQSLRKGQNTGNNDKKSPEPWDQFPVPDFLFGYGK